MSAVYNTGVTKGWQNELVPQFICPFSFCLIVKHRKPKEFGVFVVLRDPTAAAS